MLPSLYNFECLNLFTLKDKYFHCSTHPVTKLESFGKWIFRLGIAEDLGGDEKKKSRLLNFVALAGLPICVIFSIFNFLEGRNFLVMTSAALALCCVIVLVINKEKKYLLGRLFLSIMAMVVFSVAAIRYQNGAEYFLILNIIATVILFRKSSYILSLSFANALLFMLVKVLQPDGYLSPDLPQPRVLFNMAWTLLFMILALHYYKTEHVSYHAQIEESNEQLKEQQLQLLAQKTELEEKTKQLEILNHTKEKLFSVIAHDMRTPIAGLKSSLDLYHNKVITKGEFDDLSEQLTLQVDNLYNTLDNLLYWSNSQLNGIEAKPEQAALKPLVLQTISLLLENARLKQIHIEQKIPDHLLVYADANHVKLVLRNLLSNAIKFSHPQSVITIEANHNAHMVQINVKDSGVGMSSTLVHQLFTNTTLSTRRGTQNEIGTGLGLALSGEFIQKNNGEISVVSEEGCGSCFSVLLPSTA